MLASEAHSDWGLCLLAADGDPRAFRLLVSRHENRLRSFLSRLAGPQIADDLSQEAFVKAWLGLKAFRGDCQFSSWICSIGWRCFLDHCRRNRTDQSSTTDYYLAPGTDQSDAALELERLLGRLTATERAVLVLCDGHGWSHSEAASILALPLGTVKGISRRAKAKCRSGLEQRA